MAFRMDSGQPIDSEVRRIADKQLQLAIAGLGAMGTREGHRRVHTARRHVKKVRALLGLVQPRLAGTRERWQRQLRDVSRMLVSIADSEAIVHTPGVIMRRYPGALSTRTVEELQASLQALEGRVDREADRAGVLCSAALALASQRRNVHTLHLTRDGFHAVAPGLRRSVRRGRRAMRRALARPTTRRYNIWRRRVKELWFHLRLLEGCTGGALLEEQRLLERLDGLLGEAHNCALLCDALVAGCLDSRQETARALRLVRRFRSDLRQEAQTLAPIVHGTRPGAFVARVEGLWRQAVAPRTRAPAVTPWQRVA